MQAIYSIYSLLFVQLKNSDVDRLYLEIVKVGILGRDWETLGATSIIYLSNEYCLIVHVVGLIHFY